MLSPLHPSSLLPPPSVQFLYLPLPPNMEALRIIKGFAKLLDEKPALFSPEARKNLPQLDETLAALPDSDAFLVTKEIGKWCKNYPQIQQELRKVRIDIGDGEEEIEEESPIGQALIIENITLLRQKIQEATPQKPANSPTQP